MHLLFTFLLLYPSPIPPSNRYAEQVIPLLVQAQHYLERRVEQSGGPAPPQPHFQRLHKQLGHVVRAKDYLRAQLRLEVDKEGLAKTIQPGAQIDPLGHNTYSGEFSVPGDRWVSGLLIAVE